MSNTDQCFVVFGYEPHDGGCHMIKVFGDENKASELVTECETYSRTRPHVHFTNDDAQLEKEFNVLDEWKKVHPGGYFAGEYDTFSCRTVEYVSS